MRALLLPELQAYIRFEDFSGESPANVFLPGLLGGAQPTFASVLHEYPVLAKQRSVLIDLLGTGFSDGPADFSYSLEEHADTVARVLAELDLKGCNVIGYSMGGAVAITLAAMRPELVARLALMEGNLDPGGGSASKSIAEQTEELFCTHGFQAIIEGWRQEGLAGDSVSAVMAGILKTAAPHAIYRSAVGLVKGTQPTMRERFLQMAIPRAFIFGEQSLPDPDWDALASQGIRVLMVPQAGHGMPFENPRGVAEALHTALTA